MMVENIAINNNVLFCANALGIDRVVSMTSTCVFPDKIEYPITEDQLHNGPPHPSNEGYAYAKRMVEVLSRCYNEQHGRNYFTVVPTNVFGPHDNYSIEDGHVAPGLMHKCYLAKQNGTDLTIWGSGKPLRQFIFSRDLAELVVWATLEYTVSGDVLLLLPCPSAFIPTVHLSIPRLLSEDVFLLPASSHPPSFSGHPSLLSPPTQGKDSLMLSPDASDEISIADLARLVAGSMDFPLDRLVFDTSKSDGQFKKTVSNQRLRSLRPDFKFTPMEEAMRTSVQWFVDNYATCRK
jgi:GDP-L-fucose synthase